MICASTIHGPSLRRTCQSGDLPSGQQASDVAAQFHTLGSDAVYAAVAIRFGTTLLTLDREQRERVGEVLTARTPAEALANTA